MTDKQFSIFVKMGIAAKDLKKIDTAQRVGVKYPSDFSAMLNGYKKWPEGVKERLIEYLNLNPLIAWFEQEQKRRLEEQRTTAE